MTTQSTRRSTLPEPPDRVKLQGMRKSRSGPAESSGGAVRDSFLKLNPRTLMKNPGDVRGRNRRGDHHLRSGARSHAAPRAASASSFRSRSGCGSPCSLPILPKPWPKAAARRKPTRCAKRAPKPWRVRIAARMASIEEIAGSKLRAGDRVMVIAGRIHSRGRRSCRRRRLGGRIGHHRRVRAGDPRIGRRPLGGHGRHARALRRNQRPITSNPGETFLDRMIKLVEGAERQKTPNEIALNILLSGLTIIFLLAVVTLQPMAIYSGAPQSLFVLISLLVCLIPTTIGGLLSAIGIAGMDRVVQRNVLAMSGRAVEAAGDVDTLLARQNRHDHARQSPRDGIHSRSRSERSGSRRRRAARFALR